VTVDQPVQANEVVVGELRSVAVKSRVTFVLHSRGVGDLVTVSSEVVSDARYPEGGRAGDTPHPWQTTEDDCFADGATCDGVVAVRFMRQPGVDRQDEVGLYVADDVDDLIAQCGAIEAGRVWPLEVNVATHADDGPRLSLLGSEPAAGNVVGQLVVEHPCKIVGDGDVGESCASARQERQGACRANVVVVIVRLNSEHRSGIEDCHRQNRTAPDICDVNLVITLDLIDTPTVKCDEAAVRPECAPYEGSNSGIKSESL